MLKKKSLATIVRSLAIDKHRNIQSVSHNSKLQSIEEDVAEDILEITPTISSVKKILFISSLVHCPSTNQSMLRTPQAKPPRSPPAGRSLPLTLLFIPTKKQNSSAF